MDAQIQFKLKKKDKQKIKAFAEIRGLDVSPFIRMVLLEKINGGQS